MFNCISDWPSAIGQDNDKNKGFLIMIGLVFNFLEKFYETLKKKLEKVKGEVRKGYTSSGRWGLPCLITRGAEDPVEVENEHIYTS